MGEVFLGRGADGRLAAVKTVHAGFAGDPRFRARFAREVETARAVRAPWVASLLDADPRAPTPWLASEYIRGRPVGSWLGSGPELAAHRHGGHGVSQ